MASNWVCPFCNRPQTITTPQYDSFSQHLDLREHVFDSVGIFVRGIACSNPDCGEISLNATFYRDQRAGSNAPYKKVADIESYILRPKSFAKQQPDYIPQAIREDYLEACAIRDLSPKASATLSRRCLQGMIRDFARVNVKGGRLIQEIGVLREQIAEGKAAAGVTADSVDAIDAVRRVGNIGAHMEADVDHIVPVDPNEAQALIELIESLFEDWYVARKTREDRFRRVVEIAEQKDDAKASASPASDGTPTTT